MRIIRQREARLNFPDPELMDQSEDEIEEDELESNRFHNPASDDKQ